MKHLAPLGDVYQAGTLSGNPLVAAAGTAVLKELKRIDPYAALERRATNLAKGIEQAAQAADVPLQVSRCGSMFTCFFTSANVVDYQSARKCDTDRYASFFRNMLAEGVLLPPSQFEVAFLSTAHLEGDIATTLEAVKKSVE